MSKNKNSLRFFAESSIVNQAMNEPVKSSKDPKPFGLQYQEKFCASESDSLSQAVTMGQSPTNTPSSSDSCLDLDYEF